MEKNQDRTVTVTAKKIGINGEGIAYLEGKPVFVDQLLPGETAEIVLLDSQLRYAKGQVVKRLNDSPQRVKPQCPVHFTVFRLVSDIQVFKTSHFFAC